MSGEPNTIETEPARDGGLDYAETLRLKALILEHARTEPLTAAWLESFAAREEVSLSHAYVALAQERTLRLEREHAVVLGVCVGDCARRGSIAVLQEALRVQAQRARDGAPGFDVLARVCFDKCMYAPFCASRRSDGRERIYPRLLPTEVASRIAEALDE